MQVNAALGSGYAYARRASENTAKILAQLQAQQTAIAAQQAAIGTLVDAIAAGPQLDAEQLKAEIKAAIEAVTVKLTVP